jgi:peroxiredoxin
VSTAVGWTVAYQVVRQHGRLLLRLEQLEARLDAAERTQLPLLSSEHHHAAAEPAGLDVGTELPGFELPDATGRMLGPADFRGDRLLLVHWSPGCGFCELIAPDLAALQEPLLRRDTSLALVSSGDVETNREFAERYGLTCPVLLQDGSPAVPAFRGMGTPVAYLLDEQGRVAAPLAVGSDQVPELAREAAAGNGRLPGQKSLRHSRIEREGLRAGTPAPMFILPEVRGGTVALEDFRGREVLLVFSAPDCGPCDVLAPHLIRLHQRSVDSGLQIVLVGRGPMEDNRRKAQEHGMEFPVVVQDHWKLSKEYGIFATPVAFLIDRNGTVARDVARGVDQVLELGERALAGTEQR